MDQEIKNHKFDFVIYRKTDIIVLEVNYKHGPKAAQKWVDIFIPLLKSSTKFGHLKIIPITIDDYDCRSLFNLNSKKQHKITWDDYRDIIDALEKAGVKP